MTKDALILGNQSFSSRFILGSGKYSVSLIEAAVKPARKSLPLPCAAPKRGRRIIL